MLFLWNDAMIEGQIIPKWYAFVGGVVVLAVVSVCRKNQLKFAVDCVSVALLTFVVYLTARTLWGSLVPNNTFVLSLVAFFLRPTTAQNYLTINPITAFRSILLYHNDL